MQITCLPILRPPKSAKLCLINANNQWTCSPLAAPRPASGRWKGAQLVGPLGWLACRLEANEAAAAAASHRLHCAAAATLEPRLFALSSSLRKATATIPRQRPPGCWKQGEYRLSKPDQLVVLASILIKILELSASESNSIWTIHQKATGLFSYLWARVDWLVEKWEL